MVDIDVVDSATNTTSAVELHNAVTWSLLKRAIFHDNHCVGCNGGALYAYGASVAVRNSTFSNNTAAKGGAVWIGGAFIYPSMLSLSSDNGGYRQAAHGAFGSRLHLQDSTWRHNRAKAGDGGAIAASGAAVLFDGAPLFTNAAVPAVRPNTTLHVSGCVFEYNTASRSGGALSLSDNATAVIGNATWFLGNEAAPNGIGGAVSAADTSVLTAANTVFSRNMAGSGGAIGISHSMLGLLHCNLQENAASGDGGAVLAVNSNVGITGGACNRNSATNGGAVSFSAASADAGADRESSAQVLTLAAASMQHNNALRFGGAIWLNTHEYRVSAVVVQFNTAGIAGGGLYSMTTGRVIIGHASNITNNTALAGGDNIATPPSAATVANAHELQAHAQFAGVSLQPRVVVQLLDAHGNDIEFTEANSVLAVASENVVSNASFILAGVVTAPFVNGSVVFDNLQVLCRSPRGVNASLYIEVPAFDMRTPPITVPLQPCHVGSYLDKQHGTCDLCPSGTYSIVEGALGSASCEPCVTLVGVSCAGGANVANMQGHFGVMDGTKIKTVPCPTGYCGTEAEARDEENQEAEEGPSNVDDTTKACPGAQLGFHTKIFTVRRSRGRSVIGDDGQVVVKRTALEEVAARLQRCAEGREGILCTQCANGTYLTMDSAKCVPKSECGGGLAVAYWCGWSLYVVLLAVYFVHMDESGLVEATFFFYQMWDAVSGWAEAEEEQSSIHWLMWAVSSLYTMEVAVPGLCIIPTTAIGSLFLRYRTPAAVMLIIVFMLLVRWALGRTPKDLTCTCQWRRRRCRLCPCSGKVKNREERQRESHVDVSRRDTNANSLQRPLLALSPVSSSSSLSLRTRVERRRRPGSTALRSDRRSSQHEEKSTNIASRALPRSLQTQHHASASSRPRSSTSSRHKSLPGRASSVPVMRGSHRVQPGSHVLQMWIAKANAAGKIELQKVPLSSGRIRTYGHFTVVLLKQTVVGRLKADIVKLVMLAYDKVSENTFSFIQLIPIPTIGCRLFLDTTIRCDSLLVHAMMVVAFCVAMCPLAIFFYVRYKDGGSRILNARQRLLERAHERRLSSRMIWSAPSLTSSGADIESKGTEAEEGGRQDEEDEREENPWVEEITHPYRDGVLSTRFNVKLSHVWTPLLMWERLSLIFTHVFIAHSLSRQLVQTLLCVAFLCLHSLVWPFKEKHVNRLQTLYASLLVVGAGSRLPTASSRATSARSEAWSASMKYVEDVTQALFFVPVVITFAVCGWNWYEMRKKGQSAASSHHPSIRANPLTALSQLAHDGRSIRGKSTVGGMKTASADHLAQSATAPTTSLVIQPAPTLASATPATRPTLQHAPLQAPPVSPLTPVPPFSPPVPGLRGLPPALPCPPLSPPLSPPSPPSSSARAPHLPPTPTQTHAPPPPPHPPPPPPTTTPPTPPSRSPPPPPPPCSSSCSSPSLPSTSTQLPVPAPASTPEQSPPPVPAAAQA